MKDLNDLIICIPTYKRKWPNVLQLIRNEPHIQFYMFVRKEMLEDGYYDEPQFKLDNLHFVGITGVHELGETREKMLQYAIDNNYKYALQMDDSQYGLQDASDNMTCDFEYILSSCIKRFETDPLKHLAFAYIFARQAYSLTRSECETYFLTQLCQTFMLNIEICKKYDLHFRSCDVCGLEDLAFSIEAVNKGLIELSNTRFLKIGTRPCSHSKNIVGGCHNPNESYLEIEDRKLNLIQKFVAENDNITDKKYLARRGSVIEPGRYYVKFDTKYAKAKLLSKYKLIKKLNLK